MSAKIPTQINLDQDTRIDVRCQIHQLSFSPHTDAKGIMDLVQFLSPKHVILVHGEKPSMATLKEKIQSELKIKCYDPANNETVFIPSTQYIKAGSSDAFLDSTLFPNFKFLKSSGRDSDSCGSHMRTKPFLRVCDDRVAEGTLTVQKNQNPKIVSNSELVDSLGVQKHDVKFACCLPVHVSDSENKDANSVLSTSGNGSLLHLLSRQLSEEYPELTIEYCGEHLQIESFVGICLKEQCSRRTTGTFQRDPDVLYFCCSWSLADEKLAWKIVSIINNMGGLAVIHGNY